MTNNNNYYVISAGWQGLSHNEIFNRINNNTYDYICANEDEALQHLRWLRKNIVAPDEAIYIVYPDLHYQEF